MKKSKCGKCGNYFTNNNYQKHSTVCDGNYNKFVKSEACNHCGANWNALNILTASEKANHSRWCKENPKYDQYISDLRKKDLTSLMNAGKKKTGNLNQYVAAKLRGEVYESSLKGRKNLNWKPHTDETKEILRQKALASNHRRLRKGMITYKGIWLDSSWEYELAKRLDELEIKWERPDPLVWIDKKGDRHNYFPDFYLFDYDLFLDPKNPAAYENQKEKIEILKKTYLNIRFITSLNECVNFKP